MRYRKPLFHHGGVRRCEPEKARPVGATHWGLYRKPLFHHGGVRRGEPEKARPPTLGATRWGLAARWVACVQFSLAATPRQTLNPGPKSPSSKRVQFFADNHTVSNAPDLF